MTPNVIHVLAICSFSVACQLLTHLTLPHLSSSVPCRENRKRRSEFVPNCQFRDDVEISPAATQSNHQSEIRKKPSLAARCYEAAEFNSTT